MPSQTFELRRKVSSSLQLILAKICPLRHQIIALLVSFKVETTRRRNEGFIRTDLNEYVSRLSFRKRLTCVPLSLLLKNEHSLSSVSLYSVLFMSNYSLLTCNTIGLFSRGEI